jgi:hypothetical protein
MIYILQLLQRFISLSDLLIIIIRFTQHGVANLGRDFIVIITHTLPRIIYRRKSYPPSA